MQPRNLLIPGVQGVMVLEGSSTISVSVVEEVVHPARCSTTARAQEVMNAK